MIPGGRRPGEERKGRPANEPKGLVRLKDAPGDEAAGLMTLGEVGRDDRGDCASLGDWAWAGDNICGDGVSRLISDISCLLGLDSDLSELANPCKEGIRLETRCLSGILSNLYTRAGAKVRASQP